VFGVWGWGFGVGVWGFGPKPPSPNPQSPIPNPQFILSPLNFYIKKKIKISNFELNITNLNG